MKRFMNCLALGASSAALALMLTASAARAQQRFPAYAPGAPVAATAPAPAPYDPTLGGGAAAAPTAAPVAQAPEPNTSGRSEHARLGITLSDNTQGKVWVRSVDRNSAADDCGLRPNDQIIALDDKKIETYLDVVRYINNKGASDDVTVYFRRNGRPGMLTASLGSEYAGPSSGSVTEYPGNVKQRSYSTPAIPGGPTCAPGYVVPNNRGPYAR